MGSLKFYYKCYILAFNFYLTFILKLHNTIRFLNNSYVIRLNSQNKQISEQEIISKHIYPKMTSIQIFASKTFILLYT